MDESRREFLKTGAKVVAVATAAERLRTSSGSVAEARTTFKGMEHCRTLRLPHCAMWMTA
jgi:hypothetical protein